jgi:hypothetical protein
LTTKYAKGEEGEGRGRGGFFNRERREITRRGRREKIFEQKVTKETKELRALLSLLPSDLLLKN